MTTSADSAASASASPSARRGRGRPATDDGFNASARAVFLATMATGAKLAEAAQKAGVTRNVPAQHAKTDPAFRAALDDAKARGRAARAATKPHGESHYNHDGCRSSECRALATDARTRRRDDTTTGPAKEPSEAARPIPLSGRTAESSPSFLLARAS